MAILYGGGNGKIEVQTVKAPKFNAVDVAAAMTIAGFLGMWIGVQLVVYLAR